MRVTMLSYMTMATGQEYKPGDVVSFDEVETERLISVRGVRPATVQEQAMADALEAKASLKSKTIADLKALAAERGVELGADIIKKDDIIAALELAAETAVKPVAEAAIKPVV